MPTGHLAYGLLTNKVAVVSLKVMKNYGEDPTLKSQSTVASVTKRPAVFSSNMAMIPTFAMITIRSKLSIASRTMRSNVKSVLFCRVNNHSLICH